MSQIGHFYFQTFKSVFEEISAELNAGGKTWNILLIENLSGFVCGVNLSIQYSYGKVVSSVWTAQE